MIEPLNYQDLKPVTLPNADQAALEQSLQMTALQLYLKEGLHPEQIAIQMEIPLHVVAAWFMEGDWVKRRRQLERSLVDESNRRYEMEVSMRRPEVAKRQLELGKNLETLVNREVGKAMVEHKEGRMKASELKQLAEAAASATSLARAVVGLDAKAAADATADAQEALDDRRGGYVFGAKPGKIDTSKSRNVLQLDAALPKIIPTERAQSRPVPQLTPPAPAPSSDSPGSASNP